MAFGAGSSVLPDGSCRSVDHFAMQRKDLRFPTDRYQLVLGAATLLIVLQLLNIPLLYEYLVMDTRFSTVETSSFPNEKASKSLSAGRGHANVDSGPSGGKHVVYSMNISRDGGE